MQQIVTECYPSHKTAKNAYAEKVLLALQRGGKESI